MIVSRKNVHAVGVSRLSKWCTQNQIQIHRFWWTPIATDTYVIGLLNRLTAVRGRWPLSIHCNIGLFVVVSIALQYLNIVNSRTTIVALCCTYRYCYDILTNRLFTEYNNNNNTMCELRNLWMLIAACVKKYKYKKTKPWNYYYGRRISEPGPYARIIRQKPKPYFLPSRGHYPDDCGRHRSRANRRDVISPWLHSDAFVYYIAPTPRSISSIPVVKHTSYDLCRRKWENASDAEGAGEKKSF